MNTKPSAPARCAIAVCALALVQTVPLRGADLKFKLHVVNTNSLYSSSAAFDVNKDGNVDIFCGGFWYEGPTFEKRHFVREV
jgi:hypothetical protein